MVLVSALILLIRVYQAGAEKRKNPALDSEKRDF
jgi:hypothetical protein